MKRERNIKRLKSGRWQVRIVRGGRDRMWSFDTLAQARQFRDQMQLHHRLVDAGLPGLIRPRHELLALIRRFFESAESRVSHRTLTGYYTDLRPIEVYLREVVRQVDLRAEDVDDGFIGRFVRWRTSHRLSRHARRDASPVQARRTLKVLRQVYREAGIEPKWKMPALPRDRGGKRVPSPQELDALLAAMPIGSLERTVVELGLRTGMRPGDIYELRWGDVDLAAGMIRWRPGKTRRALAIPISPVLARHLRAWQLSEQRLPTVDGRVFTLEGRPLSHSSLRRRMRAASRQAGIEAFEYVGWTRNVFVGLGLERGEPYLVARAVGHTDPAITMAYPRRMAHTEALRAMLAAIDDALPGSE